MAKKFEVYKCNICGNIVEVVHGGKGILVCCGSPMTLLVENTVDAADEKHIPVVEITDKGVKVSVGQVAHPMDENHYIEWIEIIDGNSVSRKYLIPGENPEVVFATDTKEISARAYCNLHGHWKS